MKGNELIGALTTVFRQHQSADDTVVVDTGGAYTMTVASVEKIGNTTVIKTKRLIH